MAYRHRISVFWPDKLEKRGRNLDAIAWEESGVFPARVFSRSEMFQSFAAAERT
jgi:hypothetical protein